MEYSIQFISVVTILSFLCLWILDGFKGRLREMEINIQQSLFYDRINKEKYLEEAGCNVMSDPW